jgi:hypothetical protein
MPSVFALYYLKFKIGMVYFPVLLKVLYHAGHVNCSQFHAPIAMPIKGAPRSFHWEDFDRQKKLAKQIVDEFHYIYIDEF